jgi:hypothetical protein
LPERILIDPSFFVFKPKRPCGVDKEVCSHGHINQQTVCGRISLENFKV